MKPKMYKPNKPKMHRTKYKASIKKASLFMLDSGIQIIQLKFDWNLDNLAAIKSISGRQYNKEKHYWIIPLTLDNCLLVKKLGFLFTDELKMWGNAEWRRLNTLPYFNIPGISNKLRPYQNQGVSFIESKGGNALIADEMGLGKTIQALAWLKLHNDKKPVVIICPASLKYNWDRETKKWLKTDKITILNGTKSGDYIKNDIYIINYDILPFWIVAIKAMEPSIVILDEIHYIKSDKAKRTKACKLICKSIPHRIGLSGTPIESKPIEIYNAVKIINPSLFPNPWAFKQRYCGAKHNGFGWKFDGATNIPELHKILTEHVMIRRKKKDVLQDLPDKVHSFIPLPIDNEAEYLQAKNDFTEYLKNSVEKDLKGHLISFMKKYGIEEIDFHSHKLNILKEEAGEKATALYQIEILKQLAVKGKLAAAIDWLDNFLESGEKLVLFCEHIFVIDYIYNYFGNIAVKIDGRDSIKKRDIAVQKFQSNKKIKLFVGNAAAEVGLTLTAASNVGILEYPWTPGKLAQRIDRVHRITQRESVNVFFLMAINTIDEDIAYALDNKLKIFNSLLDGKDTPATDLLTDLIDKYKKL